MVESIIYWASQAVLVVKNPSANAGDIRDAGSISESGISPGGGHGNPLQCSCLENPMDRGAWRAMVYRVAKSCSDLAYSTHGVNNSSYIFTLRTLLQQVFPNPAS